LVAFILTLLIGLKFVQLFTDSLSVKKICWISKSIWKKNNNSVKLTREFD